MRELLCTAGPHPIGGIACVGMRSLSFANIAESDKSPLALLMSATWNKHDIVLVVGPDTGVWEGGSYGSVDVSHVQCNRGQAPTETPYLIARPAMVSSFVTCSSGGHLLWQMQGLEAPRSEEVGR